MRYPFFINLIRSVLLLILASSPLALATTNFNDVKWVLEKDKKGIQIYSGKVTGSGLTAYKAETEIDTKLYQLFNLLQDETVTTNWLYNLKSLKLLEIKEHYETKYYAIYSTPWPVADSSAVVRATWQYNSDNKILKNHTVSVAAGEYSNDGYLHIPLIEMHNRFQQVGGYKVKITFQVVIDNGYALPALIVDTVAIDTLYKTMKTLKKIDYTGYGETNLLNGLIKADIPNL